MKNAVVRVLVLCLLVSGCVAYSPPLRVDQQADASKAYVYGKLIFDQPEMLGIIFTGKNLKGEEKTYTMKFNRSGLSVIPLEPGVYRAERWVMSRWSGESLGELAVDSKHLTQEFRVKSGEAYFFANITAGYKKFSRRNYFDLKHVNLDFDAATTLLRTQYPQLDEYDAHRALPLLKKEN